MVFQNRILLYICNLVLLLVQTNLCLYDTQTSFIVLPNWSIAGPGGKLQGDNNKVISNIVYLWDLFKVQFWCCSCSPPVLRLGIMNVVELDTFGSGACSTESQGSTLQL